MLEPLIVIHYMLSEQRILFVLVGVTIATLLLHTHPFLLIFPFYFILKYSI